MKQFAQKCIVVVAWLWECNMYSCIEGGQALICSERDINLKKGDIRQPTWVETYKRRKLISHIMCFRLRLYGRKQETALAVDSLFLKKLEYAKYTIIAFKFLEYGKYISLSLKWAVCYESTLLPDSSPSPYADSRWVPFPVVVDDFPPEPLLRLVTAL